MVVVVVVVVSVVVGSFTNPVQYSTGLVGASGETVKKCH